MTEPYYDEDLVNLGFLKKQLDDTGKDIENATKNVSKHYGSQPVPPYNVGDTWNDGNIIYTCIQSRPIGNYVESDWITESGALDIATSKSKTYLTQPTNYQMGDMWLLQTDNDHPLGKKGEFLIANKNGKEYVEADWVKELTYVTQEEKLEIDEKIETATNNIASLQTTSSEITARVQKTEVRLDDTYTKEEVEAMNGELAEDLNVISQSVSEVKQTAEQISSEVSKKVGENEIISKINQSAEEVQINANRISLKRGDY